MRKLFALTVAAAITLGLTGAALAQGTSGGGPPGSKSAGDPSKTPTGATDPSKPPAGTSSTTGTTTGTAGSGGMKGTTGGMTSAGGAMRGQHRVMGEVTKIDQSKGRVSLKTDMGDMDLHFPPSALQGIKEGDRVEVQLALRPAGAAGAGSMPGRTGTTSGSQDAGKSPAAPAAEGSTPGKQPGVQTQPGTAAPGSPKSP
jgi:hypothetical protein